MKYKYRAKCSQCGLGWRSNFRSDLLGKMRKHMWRKHGTWMRGRIKRGLRKAKKQSNPTLQTSLLSGIFPAGNIPEIVKRYKAMSPSERNTTRTLLKALTVPVGGEASAVAEVAMRALDMVVD